MALFDEEDLFEYSEQMGEEEEEGGLTDVAALRERLFKREQESADEAAKQRQVLEQIQQAKMKLLEAPSRKEALMGLAQKLTAPRERTDPRFFERQNLYTFLRDIGEYGTEQKQAEKERQAAIAELQEKYATGALKSAEAGQTRAQQLAAQYLSKEPGAIGKTARTRSIEEEAELRGVPASQVAEERRARPAATGGRRETAEEVRVRILGDAVNTLNDPNASEADKQKAQLIVNQATPVDVRKTEQQEKAKENLYRARITRQGRVVIPDIDRAIKILDENPNIAAGNFSNWLVDLPVFGQQAKDLDSILQSVRASVGFGQLEDLKLMSPAGASGLGAVSNFEQQVLQSVEGSLARDMSAPNLKKNLLRLKKYYEEDLPAFIQAKGIDISGIGKPSQPKTNQFGVDPEAIRKERERREKAKREAGGR